MVNCIHILRYIFYIQVLLLYTSCTVQPLKFEMFRLQPYKRLSGWRIMLYFRFCKPQGWQFSLTKNIWGTECLLGKSLVEICNQVLCSWIMQDPQENECQSADTRGLTGSSAQSPSKWTSELSVHNQMGFIVKEQCSLLLYLAPSSLFLHYSHKT